MIYPNMLPNQDAQSERIDNIYIFFFHRNKKVVDYSQFGDLEDDGKWDVLVHQEFEIIASYIKHM